MIMHMHTRTNTRSMNANADTANPMRKVQLCFGHGARASPDASLFRGVALFLSRSSVHTPYSLLPMIDGYSYGYNHAVLRTPCYVKSPIIGLCGQTLPSFIMEHVICHFSPINPIDWLSGSTLRLSSLVLLTRFGRTSTRPEKSPRSEGNGAFPHCAGGDAAPNSEPIAASRDHQFSCSLGKKSPPTRHIYAARLHPNNLLV